MRLVLTSQQSLVGVKLNSVPCSSQVQRRRQQYADQTPKQRRNYAANQQQPKNKPGFKQRLSQAFTLSRSDKKSASTPSPQPLTKIHQFSFMDSKMGNYADEREIQDYMTRDLETRSDLGGVKKRASSSSSSMWQSDTLSMSTLRRAKKLLDSQAMSTSVPQLNQAETGSKKRSKRATSQLDVSRAGDSYSDFAADVTHQKPKKVNRFKFWKLFSRKKDKARKSESSSSIGFEDASLDGVTPRNDERIMDVHL